MPIVLQNMGGIAPKITPELLPDHLAQSASNLILHKGGVAPLKAPVTVATPSKSGVKKTIYRFGINQPESQYWFSWTTNVNVCRGPIPGDTTERTYFTGDGVPKKTDLTLALQGGTSYPVASYNLGVPAPTAAPNLTQVSGTGPTVAESRAYVYTNVSVWGEESAPSPASISTADATHVVKLSGFSTVPTGQYIIVKRYIYRTVTSSAGTNYYFVGEILSSATEFTDNVDVAAIGEPLATLDWDTPPDDLAGLVALPSGALCGFTGKQVCFSVIGAPYAWPQKYRLTCDYDIVAVAPMGQGVAVLTTGFPYFINTGDPEAAQMIRIDEEQACVSARSVVPFQGGVIYASPDGLVQLSLGGAKLLTESLYDRETWQSITPTSIFAAKHDNRYYAFFDSGGGLILDTTGNLSTHDVAATAAYVDPVLDQLYVAVGTNIQKWNAGSTKTTTWKTKRFNLPAPANFGCYQIKANSFSNLTLKVYVDGVLKHTASVPGSNVYRLPAGFMANLWEFEVSGTDHWTSLAVASSVQELKSV